MENEFLEKLLNILSEISLKMELAPLWKDFTFWLALATTILLFLTWFFLFRYTRATERMAKQQLMPAVDVNMIYDKILKKTYFWFSNASNVPAFASIKVNLENINGKKNIDLFKLRISPNLKYKKTATSLDFLEGDFTYRTKVAVNVTITPAFNDNHNELNFTKSYTFDKDGLRWNEDSWTYPDLEFPT